MSARFGFLHQLHHRVLYDHVPLAAGGAEDGLGELRAGLDDYRSTGAAMDWPYLLGLLADALLRVDRAPESLTQLDDALALVEATRAFFHEPSPPTWRPCLPSTARPASTRSGPRCGEGDVYQDEVRELLTDAFRLAPPKKLAKPVG